MTSGQAFGFLSDPGYFVSFCYYILVFVTIKMKFKPNKYIGVVSFDTDVS